MITYRRIIFFLILLLFSKFAFGTDPKPGIHFIENKNQWKKDIQFAAQIPGGVMNIRAGYFNYQFLDHKKLNDLHQHSHEGNPDAADDIISGHNVDAEFIGANRNASPLPFGRTDQYYNFYLGNDPSKWGSMAYGYEGFLYQNFYQGIDLKVYSINDQVKYDYIVSPYADPSQIVVQYSGADEMHLDNGNLYIKTSLGEIIEKRPVAWQVIEGRKKFVEVEYHLINDLLTFCFNEGYDPCYELVIDPLLIFSTYSGSTADNWGSTATPGEHGTLYSAGVTIEATGERFPSTPGVFQMTSAGVYDIGILKYDSLGQRLLYATYLGGSSSESPHSLVMNSKQELVVLGTTSSLDFPTSADAYSPDFNGGDPVNHVIGFPNGSDLFLSRISKDGTALMASTYMGGSGNDGVNSYFGQLVKNYGDELRGDVITDTDGNIYVSSVTSSADFPMVNGFEDQYKGGVTDAVVLKMNEDLSQLIWSNFIGGNFADASHTIKFDSDQNIYVAGGTESITGFPTTAGSYRELPFSSVDGWIAHIKNDGTEILQATLTGTVFWDQIYFLDVNKNDEVYVYGQTSATGTNFPAVGNVYRKTNSGQFLQKFSKDLSTLLISTTFGSGRGRPDISPTAFLVNDCGFIYMSGWAGGALNARIGGWNTSSFGLEVTSDAVQRTANGTDFYFIVLQNEAERILYGTFLGGNLSPTHVDGGTSRFDKGGTVYHAVCAGCALGGRPQSDFPTTQGVWSRRNRSRNCNNLAFKFDLTSLKAIIRTNSIERDRPGLVRVCIPDKLLFENFSIGGARYEWDMGDGTEKVLTDTAAFSFEYKQTGTYLVKLRTIDEGTCKGIDSTSVYVMVDRAESLVQDDDDMCFNVPYTLKASGGAQYDWRSEDGTFTSAQQNPLINPPDTLEYYVTITEATGCIRKDTVQINVIPEIHPEFTFTRSSACAGRPTLHVSNLTDSLKAEDLLYFDFGDGNTSDATEVQHQYEQDGVYKVKLVSNRESCIIEQVENIPMFDVKLPNIITPGVEDGYNDLFTIQLGEQEGVTPATFGYKVDLVIYNRWGRVLFRESDYQYEWPDVDLAAGIYYYDVTIEGHETCKSWIHVMK